MQGRWEEGMNLNKIQYFLSSVEEQSFTKAARKHYVTQVAVTQQIASMEKELDMELFMRTGNRIKVTEAGQFLYEEMKKIMAQYQFALEQLQEYRDDGRQELKIGIGTLGDYEWILPFLTRFQEKHPDMEYTFVTGETEELTEQLKCGKLSLLFSGEPDGKDMEFLEFLPAYTTKISLVVSAKSPLFTKKELSIGDCMELPLILIGAGEQERNRTYQDFYQLCRDTGFIPRVACHAENSMEAMMKVDLGLGCALYMEDVSGFLAEHPRRRILKLNGPVSVRKYLVYRRHMPGFLLDEFITSLLRETGRLYAVDRVDLKSDFSILWKEALKQEDGTYSRRLSDDQAEKEFWHHFMEKKSVYQQDEWACVMMKEVKNLLKSRQVHTIMEIGPGWGNFTMELADCCDTLTCVDISEDVLRYIDRAAQELGKKNIFSICSKWENMSGNENCDVVFGYNCFYRMLELKECLRMMNRIAASLCIVGMSADGMTPYDLELKTALGAKIVYDKKDYIHFVNILYQMGIDANVKVVPLEKELVYPGWAETVRSVMARVRNKDELLKTHGAEVDQILKKYFHPMADGTYRYRLHYRGTLVYWEPEKSA